MEAGGGKHSSCLPASLGSVPGSMLGSHHTEKKKKMLWRSACWESLWGQELLNATLVTRVQFFSGHSSSLGVKTAHGGLQAAFSVPAPPGKQSTEARGHLLYLPLVY